MKKWALLIALLSAPLFGQTVTSGSSAPAGATSSSGSKMPGSGPTTIQNSPLIAPPKAPGKDEGIKVPGKHAAEGSVSYYSPGVITYRGSWVGADNLLGVSKNIPVYIELVLPPGKQSPVTAEELKKKITQIFSKVGILDTSVAYTDKPPLPFFHILVMVQSIEKGYATFIAGRLFEEATVPRVILNDGTFFQVITWEKQDMIVASPEQTAENTIKVIEDIANNFADRYKYFDTLKSQLN